MNGAAQLYRAASSDRRERGRTSCYVLEVGNDADATSLLKIFLISPCTTATSAESPFSTERILTPLSKYASEGEAVKLNLRSYRSNPNSAFIASSKSLLRKPLDLQLGKCMVIDSFSFFSRHEMLYFPEKITVNRQIHQR